MCITAFKKKKRKNVPALDLRYANHNILHRYFLYIQWKIVIKRKENIKQIYTTLSHRNTQMTLNRKTFGWLQKNINTNCIEINDAVNTLGYDSMAWFSFDYIYLYLYVHWIIRVFEVHILLTLYIVHCSIYTYSRIVVYPWNLHASCSTYVYNSEIRLSVTDVCFFFNSTHIHVMQWSITHFYRLKDVSKVLHWFWMTSALIKRIFYIDIIMTGV